MIKDVFREQIVGVIPAAGKGLRLYPKTKLLQKTLLKIDGKSILERNISIMREQLGIKLIYLLVSDKKQQIIDALGDGKELGIDLQYVEVEDVKTENVQPSLFSRKDIIESSIVSADLNSMTPIEAFKFLFDLRAEIEAAE